jgi:O-antigen/teichoic acid export membrane protein
MVRRKLATNAFAATLQVLVTGAVLFELYRFLNRTLTVGQIGTWSVVLASAAAGRMVDLGFGSGVVRFVAEYLGSNARTQAAMTIQIAFVAMTLLMSLSCVVLYPLLYELLAHLIREPAALPTARALLPYAFITLILGALAAVMLSALDGCQRMDLRSAIGIVGSIVQLLAAYCLVPSHGLQGLAAGQILQGLTMLVLAGALTCRELGLFVFRPIRWERATFMRLLRYGGGVQAAAIGQFLFEPVTKALLTRYGSLELTGYYEMANRMIVQLRSVIVSAYQVLVPYVAGSGMGTQRVQEVYLSSYRLLLSMAAPYYALVGIFLPFVLRFWRGHFETDFLLAANACLFGWAFNTLTTPAYFMYLGLGKTRWPVATHMAIGLFSAVLGSIAGHIFGGFGVLCTVAGVQALGSYIVAYAFHKEQGIDVRLLLPKEALGSVVAALGATIAMTLIAVRYGGTSGSVLVIVAVLLAVTILALAWQDPNRRLLTKLILAILPMRPA